MWPGFDPEIQRQLAMIKEVVARSHQEPTHEWPVVVPDHRSVLVVREWPDGALTAYSFELAEP